MKKVHTNGSATTIHENSQYTRIHASGAFTCTGILLIAAALFTATAELYFFVKVVMKIFFLGIFCFDANLFYSVFCPSGFRLICIDVSTFKNTDLSQSWQLIYIRLNS